LKPGIDFQYTINAKGSSPAEILGTGYKTVLKQGLVAHADVNKRIRLANLEEVNDLQKQMQGNVKALEGERNNISSLQATNDNVSSSFQALHYIYSL
jgi:kinetochore protein NDC80